MKTKLILLFHLLPAFIFAQKENIKLNSRDPFLNFITKAYFLENISFEAHSKKKGLFDLDTIYSSASITAGKYGDSIIFLQVINSAKTDELLFYNDSAWHVNHNKKELKYLGTGFASAGHHNLYEFFPASLYTIDTLINQMKPFWRITREDDLYDLVDIGITDKPEEISEMNVEVLIKCSDSLIYSFVKEAVFKGMTARLYEEMNYQNYSFPESGIVLVPGYVGDYHKIITEKVLVDTNEISDTNVLVKDIFLKPVELYDLDRNAFLLPEDGLIFIDLWYVGCFPCMKAAPVIENLYQEYKDRLHFYSVNEIDADIEKIRRFKEMMGISFPVLLGGKEKLAIKVNNSNAYPAYFLMDASDGKVLWNYSGYSDQLKETMTEIFDRYLRN